MIRQLLEKKSFDEISGMHNKLQQQTIKKEHFQPKQKNNSKFKASVNFDEEAVWKEYKIEE